MEANQALLELLAVLGDLFPNANDIRDIALQAGIKPETFDSTGNAIHIWQSLLEEARKQVKLHAVFQVTSTRYPNAPQLQPVWNNYLTTMADQAPQVPGKEAPVIKEMVPTSDREIPAKSKGSAPGKKSSKRRSPRRKPFPWFRFLFSGAAGISFFFLLYFIFGRCTGCGYQQLPLEFQYGLLLMIAGLIAALVRDLYKRKRSERSIRQNRILDTFEVSCSGFLLLAGFILIYWVRTDGNQYVALQCTVTPTPSLTPSPSLTASATPTHTPTRTPTPTLPPSLCAYPPGTDRENLEWLIHSEAEAVSLKDLALIQRIFAPDAWIWDAVNQTRWTNPWERYKQLFDEVQTIKASHADVEVADKGIQSNLAWLTSSSITTIDDETTYPNPPLSEHWTFERDPSGCWVITSLIFNASHIPFPCYCQGDDDDALRCLINAEAEAVKNEDLLLVGLIFSPEASIYEGENLKSSDPLEYYKNQLFDLLDFTDPVHFDIHPLGTTSQQAWYTSGSRGAYAPVGAKPTSYMNENPSEHWTFGRNLAGCWVITRFAFNAKHLPFQP